MVKRGQATTEPVAWPPEPLGTPAGSRRLGRLNLWGRVAAISALVILGVAIVNVIVLRELPSFGRPSANAGGDGAKVGTGETATSPGEAQANAEPVPDEVSVGAREV